MAIRTLGDLVGVENEGSFRASFVEKKRWHAAMPSRPQVTELLPWSELDRLIASNAVPGDHLRVLINAREMLKALYVDDKGRLRPDAIQSFSNQGATLTIDDIGLSVPAIGELEASIERTLRCRTIVNAYISFGEKAGFLAHRDAHDVLILQVSGTKRWSAFGTPLAYPVRGGHTGSPPDCVWEGLMTPGDLLYLPRGEIHSALPEDVPSVHLTFAIAEDTGVDFLRWLAGRAESAVSLRRDLGATLTGDARALRDRELMLALHNLIDATSVAEFAEHRDRERRLRPLVALGPVGRLRADAQLSSALRRRLDLELDREGIVLLEFGRRQIRLSQRARQVLARITERDGITVAALADAMGLGKDWEQLLESIEELAETALISIEN